MIQLQSPDRVDVVKSKMKMIIATATVKMYNIFILSGVKKAVALDKLETFYFQKKDFFEKN